MLYIGRVSLPPNIMKSVKDIVGIEEGNEVLIIGAGNTLISHKKSILNRFQNASSIGVNNMVDFKIPKYHIWTNSGRYGKFSSCINSSSTLLIGNRLKKKVSKKHAGPNSVCIDYIDREGTPVGYKNGQIKGFFRTAGCLSIMIAHLMKAKSIYVAGMDGYTLHSREELQSKSQHQHLPAYGRGHTDSATWDDCVRKDELVYRSLRSLKEHEINFSIITPTVFDEFYDSEVIT